MDFKHDILPLKDRIFRVALRVTLNREESEDVVQDVLLRLWQRRDELASVGSIEAYATKMAYNRAIDCKERMANKSLSLSDIKHDCTDDSMMMPDDTLTHNESISLVERTVNKLPEKQRSVVQLRDIEGKTYKEIADILSISEADVKVTLFRARNKIRQTLSSRF